MPRKQIPSFMDLKIYHHFFSVAADVIPPVVRRRNFTLNTWYKSHLNDRGFIMLESALENRRYLV